MKDPKILAMLQRMTLREKIYQTICHHADESFYQSDPQALRRYAQEKPYGAFFVGEEIIGNAPVEGEQVQAAIREYRQVAAIPPLFSADVEFGCGYMFRDKSRCGSYPWQMTLGATGSVALAYEYGKYTALDARDIGVNWAFAPVCDINYNYLNPVVNTRAFGDRAPLVADLSEAVVRGMQDYGLAATAKHFPGDGTDHRDQHFVMTSNWFSTEKWMETYGAVYRRLIAAGVSTVMVGHINLPAYERERFAGVALPGSLSHELMTGLLKQELGFDGIVVSDAVCMNGFRVFYQPQVEAELHCFAAGCDVLLWPSPEYPAALEERLLAGEIPMERLEDAVYRVLSVKARFGLLGEPAAAFPQEDRRPSLTLDDRISRAGVTLVWDKTGLLPLRDARRVVVIALTPNADEFAGLHTLQEALAENGVEAILYQGECPADDWPACDAIVYVTFCHQHRPTIHLDVATSWQTASYQREKVIAVALGSPYLLSTHFETVPAAVAAYSDTPGAQRAVADALCGRIPFAGRLPVRLPDAQLWQDIVARMSAPDEWEGAGCTY